ncbi:MAG: hypothetical protein ISS31_06470 [Kiritimatiellae bacterium]|nr:hypothetical protein [Kiritimatiellia bacterium]
MGVLKIDTARVVHKTPHRNLTGSNIALWNQPWELGDSALHRYVRELAPALVRIPGGSWANHYIWNGNGIRLDNVTDLSKLKEHSFDLSKLKDGIWEIDWSGFAPGFSIAGDERRPVSDHFHGSWDVKQLHEFVGTFRAKAVVTVNLGTGTPEMAAEWVRWANKKNGYGVQYWELGNELEGSWELGHILPDGREITGDIYAQRFKTFATAMKAVDPTIKTGGPASSNDRGAFIQEVLRDAGDLVDFVSFHSYPVKNRQKTEAEFFDEVFTLEPAIKRIHSWIAQYQPDRKDEIGIGITEWNSKVVEDRVTADLMNGLWCAMWIGEMFRNGVDFANQWDMITATETGGHGLFYFDQFDFYPPGVSQAEIDRQFNAFDPPCIPKGQYWALWLWSRYMGDELVASTLTEANHLYSAVTRGDDGLQILLINHSRDEVRTIALKPTEALSRSATAIQLSHREYFWNPLTRKPQWSRRPEAIQIEVDGKVSVPPFCAVVLQIPFEESTTGGAAVRHRSARAKAKRPACELLLPGSTPEDVPVEAWVLAPAAAPCSVNQPAQYVHLAVDGPATLDRARVRINEGAGRFSVTPTGTGVITVRAGEASATLKAVPVQSRIEILWPFEEATEGIRSDFDFLLSDRAKPNQHTAAIRLREAQPTNGKNSLLEFKPIPDGVQKARTGGFALEIKGSHDLSSGDPSARLLFVLQSESDHWIQIGELPLKQIGSRWRQAEFRIEDYEDLPAMQWLYAVRILLASTRPVSGEIFINDAGLILR